VLAARKKGFSMPNEVKGRVLAWYYAWIDQLRLAWPAGVPFNANMWEILSREQIVQIGKRACEQSGVTVGDLEGDEGYRHLEVLFNEPRTFRGPERANQNDTAWPV
jgi:hypothetical protein